MGNFFANILDCSRTEGHQLVKLLAPVFFHHVQDIRVYDKPAEK